MWRKYAIHGESKILWNCSETSYVALNKRNVNKIEMWTLRWMYMGLLG